LSSTIARIRANGVPAESNPAAITLAATRGGRNQEARNPKRLMRNVVAGLIPMLPRK